jgi:tRNA (guanine-N7-)-methyltransferase
MRPENFKYPFIGSKKHTSIQNGVWFVDEAEESINYTFPGWGDATIFPHPKPVKIEYCSGNGLWLAQKAMNDPHSNWVGVEIKFSRIRKIWSKKHNHQMKNLLPICSEALYLTEKYIPDNSVHEIYINFPDPWPKRRHAKYRLIQPKFVVQLHRILVPGGKAMLVTDDVDYSQQMIRVFQSQAGFQSLYPNPFYSLEYDNYGTSYFEDLWRTQGKEIRYHHYTKA